MYFNQLKKILIFIVLIISASLHHKGLANQNAPMDIQEWFVLAKSKLNEKDLDAAEEAIERVLKSSNHDPNHLFMAGRIAGAQAQEASIFSKLGYARDAKKYFEKALALDPKHKDSILGLIRFHEQAPVMAGGEKESIPALIKQLRTVDRKLAFSMESSKLVKQKEFELLEQRFTEALEQTDSGNPEQFKYDYAMTLSNYGYYSKALDIILTINLERQELITDFAAMRLYQVAKLTAESGRELDSGLASIQEYSRLPVDTKTIPSDWIDFRTKQLQFLKGDGSITKDTFKTLRSNTNEKSLKAKIKTFLQEVKS